MIREAQTSQTGYLYNEYDSLREVIVSTGYYGSCGRCETQSDSKYVAHRLASVDDKTPILNGARPLRGGRNINIRVFSLGILFIGGFTIGSYLLYAQDYTWPIELVLDLVSRDEWEAKDLDSGRPLNSKNVIHVLLQHTSTKNCYNFDDCKKFLNSYQAENSKSDIPFNFLIGGDGRAYEGRGSSVESANSPIRSDSVMSIAFIGDFTKESPSTAQLNSASALIAELVHQKKIASNYSIFGIQHIKKAHHDGSALFEVTSKWKRWDELLTIY